MASNNIARLGVVLGLDTAEFTAEIDKAIAKERELKRQIKSDTNAAAGEVARLTYATQDYGKVLTQVELVEREISSGRYMKATDEMKQRLRDAANAYDAIHQASMKATGGMSAFQKQSLMYQTTDFVTQVASGQNAMIAFIQQGGQLKDTMGGFGPMFKALGQLITPFRLAMGGLATVFGVVGLAAYKGSQEFNRLRDDLILTGNFAGITQQKFADMAKSISESSSSSIGDTKTVMSQLVASGRFTSDTFDSVTAAILKFSKVSGLSADEAAQKLIPSFNGTASAAKSLNEQYHFLTLQQYKNIEALEKQGKRQEAIIEMSTALNESLSGTKRELGFAEKAWKAVTDAASAAWAAMLNIGKPQTLDDQLAQVTANILRIRQQLITRPNDIGLKAELEASYKKYDELSAKKYQTDEETRKKSAAAAEEERQIALRAAAGGLAKEQSLKYELEKQRLENSVSAEKEFASEVGIIQIDAEKARQEVIRQLRQKNEQEQGVFAVQNAAIAAEQIKGINEKEARDIAKYKFDLMVKEYDENIALQDEAMAYAYASQKRLQDKIDAQKLSGKKIDIELEYQKEYFDMQSRSLFMTERETAQAKLRLDIQKKLNDLEAEGIDNLDVVELKRANILKQGELQSWVIDATDKFKLVKEQTDSVFNNMAQAIDNFVKNGKLSFKDLARSIIQDLIAIAMKQQMLKLFNFAMSAYQYSGSTYDTAGLNAPTPKAAGGPVSAGMTYLVGEKGPELFTAPNSGTIVPNHQLSAIGGGGQTINYNGPYIANMSAIDTQSAQQFLAKNKMSVWAANQSANRSIPQSR